MTHETEGNERTCEGASEEAPHHAGSVVAIGTKYKDSYVSLNKNCKT
jgi:hypothetical protein